MSDITETIEAAKADALKRNCEVVESDEFTLLLDFDSIAARKQYEKMRPKFDELFEIQSEEEWASGSGGEHCHLKIVLKRPLAAAERVALQACLGSDPYREMFSIRRIKLGIEHPILLFRPEGAAVTTKGKLQDPADLPF